MLANNTVTSVRWDTKLQISRACSSCNRSNISTNWISSGGSCCCTCFVSGNLQRNLFRSFKRNWQLSWTGRHGHERRSAVQKYCILLKEFRRWCICERTPKDCNKQRRRGLKPFIHRGSKSINWGSHSQPELQQVLILKESYCCTCDNTKPAKVFHGNILHDSVFNTFWKTGRN
jgi:hypothetical protein